MLTADRKYSLGGVTVNEYLLTKHNPNNIDMPWHEISKPIGVTIHNTDWIDVSYNTTPAEQYTRATVNGNMGDVRVHFYVDDVCAWQNLPLDLSGWHAADGDGDGNRKTIAKECIMSSHYDGQDKRSEDNCAKLAAALLKKYGLGIDRLYTHNHWYSLKYCPAYILPHWSDFVSKVKKYMNENAEKPILDKSGYCRNDNTIGSLSLKKLLLIAKELGVQPKGMDEKSRTIGDGTINAINYCLKKWGYKENGIAGEKFIKKVSQEIRDKISDNIKATEYPVQKNYDANKDGKTDVRDMAYIEAHKSVFDKYGYKSGDATIGSLALKELLITAKKVKLDNLGMDENKVFGAGTLTAVNYLLNKWGYKQTGIAGENFIQRVTKEIISKV